MVAQGSDSDDVITLFMLMYQIAGLIWEEMFCPQISLGNAVFVKQSYIFLTEKFLRAFKILICFVTIQRIIIIWETQTAILLLGSFLRLPFL